MKAVVLEYSQATLDERRRLGQDVRDEMWDGVLHVVPPPGGPHQDVNHGVFFAFYPLASARGLVPRMETGLYRDADNYRVPDQMYFRPDQKSERGAEGAELVVEVHAATDETDEKLDFYAGLGVHEVLVVHPVDRRVEVFRAVGGRLLPVQAVGGVSGVETLGVELRTVDGVLHLTWDGGSVEL